MAPQSEIERRLIEIWEEVLGTQPVGIRDDFFELGGHSLLAARLCARIKEGLGVELPIATLFRAATVEQLAETLRETGGLPASPVLVPLQPGGSQPPFFCVHGLGGGVWGYAELARLLGPEQPFYGLQARGVEGEDAPHTRLEDMAAAYIEAMRSVQPRGPYRLGGYSAGGLVAFEMACQLHAQGEQVALLSLFDTYAPLLPGARRQRWNLGLLISFLRNLPLWLRDFWQREDKGRRLLTRLRVAARATMRPGKRDKDHLLQDAMVLNMLGAAAEIPEERRRVVVAHLRAMEDYRPQVYAGKVTLIRVRGMRLWRPEAADLGWGELAGGGVEVREIPGAHYNILAKPHVDALAAELKAGLARIADGPGQPEP